MAPRTAKLPRIHEEAAFVLHRHDWSESSLILDVFSRQHGRVALVAKGAKRPTSQFRAVLLPLQPLRLAWGGDAEVRTLKSAAWQGGQLMPQGDALLAGYYLNELLLKMLARDDAHPLLFDHYAQAIGALAHGAPQAAVLRAFELLLLRETGHLPALDHDGASLVPLQPASGYRLQPEQGLLPTAHARQAACPAGFWGALQQALDGPEAFAALCRLCQDDRAGALRRQLRDLLHYHSGVRVFQTRQLLADVQRLAG
jgi:DNA repair protein RecO (recombination protein O)